MPMILHSRVTRSSRLCHAWVSRRSFSCVLLLQTYRAQPVLPGQDVDPLESARIFSEVQHQRMVPFVIGVGERAQTAQIARRHMARGFELQRVDVSLGLHNEVHLSPVLGDDETRISRSRAAALAVIWVKTRCSNSAPMRSGDTSNVPSRPLRTPTSKK